MAYLKTKLLHVGGGVSPLPQRFDYFLEGENAEDTVTTEAYFPKDDVLKAGDLVTAIKITKSEDLITAYSKTEYYLKADAKGVLTAVAVA